MKSTPSVSLRQQLISIGLAILGAVLAWLLHIPLAPLIGATIALALGRRRWPSLGIDERLRTVAVAVSGTVIGASVEPGLLDAWRQWLLSLGFIFCFVIISAWVGRQYLLRVAKQDATTALLCAQPGGILVMLSISEAVGGQTGRVLFAHGLRIACGASIMIALLSLAGFSVPAGIPSGGRAGLPPMSWPHIGLAALLGLSGWLVGKKIRLPAPELLGPMLATIVGVQMGWISGAVPLLPLGLSMLLIGASVGGSMPAVSGRALLVDAFHSLAVLALFLLVAFGMGELLALISNVRPVEFFLAASPTGLSEMPTLAMLIQANAAYVAMFGMLRFLLCAFVASWQTRKLRAAAVTSAC